MRRFRRVLLLLAALALLAWWLLPGGVGGIDDGSILVLDVEGDYVEAAEPSLVSRLLGDRSRPFASVLSELAKAQRDDRLAGVVVRIRNLGVGWGKAQELRQAIRELADSGRPTLAYLEVGSLAANREYLVATGAPTIVAAPGGASPLIGLAAEYLFLGGLWDKLGAGVEAIGSGEYKSAAETLVGTKMSPAHREMARSLLDSTFSQFVADIAEGRSLEPELVRDLIDRAPVAPEELLELGLVDDVAFLDEAVASLGDGPVVTASRYRTVSSESVGFDPVAHFALVYGAGAVMVGKGTASPAGGLRLASDTVSEALQEAAEDPQIAAIILRIDSPGGSPLASDIVWRAAERAKESGKPLVASVSSVAASGGYYVLCGADAIVAPASSLVGSVGVFAMRPVVGGLLEKLGIGVETMTRGSRADVLLASQPLTPEGREHLRAEIDAIYETFLSRVSGGRGLSRDEVHAVGRGRVWTGAQALENGLVDELGGLRAAVRRVKQRLGIDADADVALVPYPKPRSLYEQLGEVFSGSALRASPTVALPPLLRQLEPLLAVWPDGGVLLVPPLLVEIR